MRARLRGTVNVYQPSFRPSPSTYIVVLAWMRDKKRFREDCLLVPSEDVGSFAKPFHYGHLSFDFRPGARDDRLQKYHAPLKDLEQSVLGMFR